MADCNHLLFLIRQNPEGEEHAMKLMLQDRQYQRAAYVAYRNYGKIHAIVDWEDILYDAVVRFVHMVKRFDANGKPLTFDCLVYFKTICRNICSEYVRYQKPIDHRLFDLFEFPADLVPSFTESLVEKLMKLFTQLTEKCQILLEARFLWNPQEKDKNTLSELVDGTVSPGSVSTTLNRCKNDLREIVADKLDDLLNS